MRRLFAFIALAASMIVAQPAFAQGGISVTGYADSGGRAAAVRATAPLPTLTTPFALPASRWQYAGATGGIVNTTAVALNAAAGAGIRNYVAACQFFNSAAVASEIEIRDGVTVIWRGYVAASMVTPELVSFPLPLRGTANTAINVAMGTTATATRVSCQGFTSTI